MVDPLMLEGSIASRNTTVTTTLVPTLVDPSAGLVPITVGGLFNVKATVADVVVFPEVSRASADSVWLPLVALVLFQATVYGDVVSSAPMLTPSSLNCTPTTATLSEIVADKLTAVPPMIALLIGDVTDSVGGVR